MPSVIRQRLLRLLRLIGTVYVGLFLVIGLLQRRIMYFPFYKTEAGMLTLAHESGCEPWRDTSGKIIGWKSERPKGVAANRMIVFHGNAGYALMRTQYPFNFERLDGGKSWEVYLFEYPGFGARPGKLGQQPFIEAGLEAMDELRKTDSRPIYLLGESLGSGMACELAGRRPEQVAGLFLVTPYARIADVAAQRFWYLPVRWMLRDPWDNVTSLKGYRGSVAMLIAEKDEVVTAEQGRLLFTDYSGRKRLWTEPGATHNGLDFSPAVSWWQDVSDFLLEPSSARLSAP